MKKGTTIIFEFEQKGFNAHAAEGKFTYSSPDNAKKAAADMLKNPAFKKVVVK